METNIKWYDSVWLSNYLDAKDIIAESYPHRLEEFVERLNILRTNPAFTIKELPGLLDQKTIDFAKKTINEIPMSMMKLKEVRQFGRFVVHDHPVFLKMQAEMTDMVSELVGESVEPYYNFLSLYTRMGICEPHMDSPEAKWTLDICIDQSERWPIHFSQIVPWPEDRRDLGENWQQTIKNDPNLTFETKILDPGNAILFAGSSQWHYRDAIPQANNRGFCNLLFFHFIPKGTKEIINPRNWARLFEMPELVKIPGLNTEN